MENYQKPLYIEVEKLNPKNINLSYDFKKVRGFNRGTSYINAPVSFDIETTSTYINGQKAAYMYIWMVAIYEDVYIGRTWKSFKEFLFELCSQNDISDRNRLVIYVHNLSFEFQFIKNLFEWKKQGQLMIDTRKPCKIATTGGIEFRCSYILSNAPLSDLNTVKYKKASGDLDYTLKRNQFTPLSDVEIGYCINDVLVLTEYITHEIEYYGNIIKIPKTATGSVRNHCKEKCCINNPLYRECIQNLTLDTNEYLMLKECFQGGFTHASAYHSGSVMEDVTSYDFTSSYPAVLVGEQFPMSKGIKFPKIKTSTYTEMIKKYCVMAKIGFTNLREKLDFEHPLSMFKCEELQGERIDNGRVISADLVITTITELDYKVMCDFYEWDEMTVLCGYAYEKAYLPKVFIQCILEFYQKKTTLKGVPEREDEYMRGKAMLNSCYGMTVTDICKPENIYDNFSGWIQKEADVEKSINKYNESKVRFLYYPWGVWTTAYARYNLFTGIKECGYDYIYADTDSVKIINAAAHKEYFDRYNENCIHKIRAMAERYDIPLHIIEPVTIKGESKPLGVWDYDGHYRKFKTLGAKRYLTIDDDDVLHLTVSGVQKKAGADWLLKTFGSSDAAMDGFKNGLIFPAEGTGKNTHTYIDDAMEFDDVDYLGNKAHIVTLSGTHLEGSTYEMTLSEAYRRLLDTIILKRSWI